MACVFFRTDFLPLGLQEGSPSITIKVKARLLWITVNYLSAPRPTSSPGRFSLALLEEKRPGDEVAPRLLRKNRRLIVGNLHINKVCKLKKMRDGPLFFWRGGGGSGVRKLWNRLFAEAVRTEINFMEVKIKVFAWRRKHKKTVCMWKFSNPLTPTPPPPPLPTLKKIMVCGFSLLTFAFRGRF